MTWGELTDLIYARYDSGDEDDSLLMDYDVKLHDAIGSNVGGFEIDHDAQAVILKYEAAT